MLIPKEWTDWSKKAAQYWRKLGASKIAAPKFALLWGFATVAGLKPRITSVYRDPKKQKRMQERWDAGDRAGLRARPATSSKHAIDDWLGNPASKAMDMVSSNDNLVAKYAKWIGLGAGADFTRPDPGHYYLT